MCLGQFLTLFQAVLSGLCGSYVVRLRGTWYLLCYVGRPPDPHPRGTGARAARGHVPAYLDVLLKRGVAGVELVAQEVQQVVNEVVKVGDDER